MEDGQITPEVEQWVNDYLKWDNEVLALAGVIEGLAHVVRHKLTALGVDCPDEATALDMVRRHIEARLAH